MDAIASTLTFSDDSSHNKPWLGPLLAIIVRCPHHAGMPGYIQYGLFISSSVLFANNADSNVAGNSEHSHVSLAPLDEEDLGRPFVPAPHPPTIAPTLPCVLSCISSTKRADKSRARCIDIHLETPHLHQRNPNSSHRCLIMLSHRRPTPLGGIWNSTTSFVLIIKKG